MEAYGQTVRVEVNVGFRGRIFIAAAQTPKDWCTCAPVLALSRSHLCGMVGTGKLPLAPACQWVSRVVQCRCKPNLVVEFFHSLRGHTLKMS